MDKRMYDRNIADRWNIISKPGCYVRLFFLFLILPFGTPASAQGSKCPVYADQAISRPVGLPQFKSGDFQVNSKRLTLYPNGFSVRAGIYFT